MNEEHRKPGLKKSAKANLLNDLEDLSGMLDEDSARIEKELTQPYDLEDLPVLKSFVEDVPTLSESLEPAAEPSSDPDDPLAISPEVRQKAQNASGQPQPAEAPTLTNAAPQVSKDNPFLPKSTLEKLNKEVTQPVETQASQELRNLVKQRSLPNFSPNSKEYQALRNDASKMVNEVIKLFIPRMEAELRMRLEKEVDQYLNELRKNAQD